MERTPINSTEERMRTRTRTVAAAVREARGRRGWSVRTLAKNARMSPSTLSRVENPDSEGSLKVETLESLAVALNCPLCELLGEPMNIEYRGIGDWPEALRAVLAKRGGFVTPAERAFIEDTLVSIRSLGTGGHEDKSEELLGRESFWQPQMERFRKSRRWRVIENLIVHSGAFEEDSDGLAGLELTVRALMSAPKKVDVVRQLVQVEPVRWISLPVEAHDGSTVFVGVETGTAKVATKSKKPAPRKRKAGPSKKAAKKKTRRKKARS